MDIRLILIRIVLHLIKIKSTKTLQGQNICIILTSKFIQKIV